MNTRNESLDKELMLIRSTFNTPQGKELLEMWTKYHVMSAVFDVDTHVMAGRVARLEFVTTILNCLEGG